VRVLLLAHEDLAAASLADALRPAGFEASVGTAHDGRAEAVLVGTRGELRERIAACVQLRSDGFRGPLLVACADGGEGQALLDAGADDFVMARYEPLEVAVRLRACERRDSARSHLRWGPLDLDPRAHTLRLPEGRVTLTNRECALLACLIEARGGTVPRARLREGAWPSTEDRGTNLVEVHLSRLRDKLGAHAAVIETVRGAGYRLRR
jgi:two-component system OmpR family response regulator